MRGLVLVVLLAAAFAGPAAAAQDWSVSGNGIGTGIFAEDQVEVGAHSDVGGANPRGHGELHAPEGFVPANDGGEVVCLRVVGNRALVVWHMREPQTLTTLPGFVGEFGAVYVEDNGPPVEGQPVDRMVDFSLRSSTAELFCETDLGFTFAALAEPLASGNFVVNG
jgi:hypothetical protein